MHRLFIPIFIIFFSLPNLSSAQWVEQESGTTSILLDVEFLNENTGFISGWGRILKTTNSGENWINLNIPPESLNKSLYSIHPVNENVIYCVGSFEVIIKSTDGGNSWAVISDTTVGDGHTYFTCFFVNENTGWVSGSGDKVLKTTNGGISFDTTDLGQQAGFIKEMYFRNETDGIIAGESSTIRKTTNAGLTWDAVSIPVGTIGHSFRGLTFANSSTGWLFSRSRKVFKTTDFGSNWDSLSSIPGDRLIYCADFPSTDTGFVTGQIDMYKTTDGAKTWVQENFPTNPPTGAHNSIFFVNSLKGWVCTYLGRIIHTTNGGDPLVNIHTINNNVPDQFYLSQNYPNPFNPTTAIKFGLPKKEFVTLKVYDISGREVAILLNDFKNAGSYIAGFDALHLSSGVYFYTIKAGSFEQTKRMVLIK